MNILLIAILVISDQLTKHLTLLNIKAADNITLIDKYLYFTYVENSGAAFGILQDSRLLFIIFTLAAVILIVYVYKKYQISKKAEFALELVTGGALGNFADRIRLGYVIDFIDVKFGSIYDFPVFNLADIYIVTGTFLLMFLIITEKHEKEI